VAELFGPKAPRLRFKFLQTSAVLEAVRRAQLLTQAPFFAYLHVLDLHAPYISRARWTDDDYLTSVVPAFMSRCYLGDCDVKDPHDRWIIEHSRATYLEIVDDLDRHVVELMRLAEGRKRPFKLVVTADHGELFGERGGFAHGAGFVPELLSVPFAVYDSTERRGSRDCRLLTSAEALWMETEDDAVLPMHPASRERIEIDGRPLGTATVDRTNASIAYTIADDFVRHQGTWRNLHTATRGNVPFRPARCDAPPN
jgi:hypothetical protein